MGEEGCMCVVGEKKKERRGVHGWVGGRVGKEIKRKKEMGSGIYVYGGKKRGEWKRKKEKRKIYKGKN